MYWDVKVVKPLENYCIYVELENNKKGIFDLKPYLDRGVIQELKNVHYFNQVDVLFGAVTWPNEQDIAPETLLEEMVLITTQGETVEEALANLREANEANVTRQYAEFSMIFK